MTWSRRVRRPAQVALVAVAVVLLAGLPAAAAPTPSPATLSDVQTENASVRTVLTVPASAADVTIDPSSVRATIGGQPARVTVTPLQQEQRLALLVLDTSGSMGEAGIAAATQAAQTYLSTAPSDLKVGLLAFSDTPRLVVAPTLDRAAVTKGLTGLVANGETSLYDALQFATKTLGSQGSRSLILLSDGGDTVSKSPLTSSLAAITSASIRVDVVGFRTNESQNSVLTAVARAGKGSLLAAGSATALNGAFQAAARALAGQVRLQIDTPAGLSGTQPLVVDAVANGQPVQATANVSLVAAATTPATETTSPAEVAPAPARPLTAQNGSASLWLWSAAGAVFVGLLTVGWFVASPLFTPAARRRVQQLDDYVGLARRKVARKASPNMITDQVLHISEKLIEGRESTRRSAVLLERADLPLRVNEWYVLRAVAVVVSVSAAWLLFSGSAVRSILGLALGVIAGVFGPAVFLRIAASRRAKKFDTQLPDALTLMASSLATGFSLPQSIDAIVRDAAQPTAKEFARALAETRIGAELEDSLDRLAQRMGSQNLEWTTMAIRIQRQVGGNLAETLRTTATTIRDREALMRHVRALSAEGRLSAYILIALPIGLFFYMLKVNPDYVSLLWSSFLGLVMSVIGVILLGIGVVWMRKVVEVKV